MLGQLVQRLALVLARLLLGLREGVAAGHRPVGRQRQLEAGFDAARHCLVHVHVRGGVRTELVGAVRALRQGASHPGDLVLEVVVEQRDAGAHALAVVIKQADFLGHGLFGRQVRVAVHVAATARLAPAGHGLAQVGRTKARGDAALQGPAFRQVPHAVQARAEMAAEVLVLVHAQAGRDGEAFGQAPFVLGEQCPLIPFDLARAAGKLVARLVVQALVQVAAAQRQHVRTQRQRPAGLQVQVLDLHLARAVVELFLLHVAVGHAPAPAAGVRQRPLAAAVIGFRGRRAAGARARLARRQRLDRLAERALELLAHRRRFQHDVVIAVGCERQLGGNAFRITAAISVVDVVFVALRGLAVDLQAQQVVLDRAGQVEIALVDVARLAAFLDGRVHADFAVPFFRHLARDDVDHPAHGVRAVQRRHRPAHDFNALDGRQRRRPAAFDARRI